MRARLGGLIWLACASAAAACASTATAPELTLRADSGGLWKLSNQRGETVLLTFGFTHCTDTCPATLAKLIRLTGSLQRSRDVEIAFVTIDPARDTEQVMHRFLARFGRPGDGRLVGLTGTPAEIERVKTAYHVWSQPASPFEDAHGDKPRVRREDDIAHTAVIFIIDRSGRIAAVNDDDASEQSLAHELAKIMPAS